MFENVFSNHGMIADAISKVSYKHTKPKHAQSNVIPWKQITAYSKLYCRPLPVIHIHCIVLNGQNKVTGDNCRVNEVSMVTVFLFYHIIVHGILFACINLILLHGENRMEL